MVASEVVAPPAIQRPICQYSYGRINEVDIEPINHKSIRSNSVGNPEPASYFISATCFMLSFIWNNLRCHILVISLYMSYLPLHWRHKDRDGVSNHQPHDCLLNLLFRRRSKKTSKLRVTGLCVGNSPGPVNSPHKGPVTRKIFPFDVFIMLNPLLTLRCFSHQSKVTLLMAWHIYALSGVHFDVSLFRIYSAVPL